MEKSYTGRPQRNRRHSRRAWPPEDDLQFARPVKRLFTPEIKRMLKDWLIRRRENPYPSRDEKKRLAIETGLTYTQICNWFANWRRKLKNSERERTRKSWGHLIKNYNTNARGNVEQFSISSEDSIWEEEEPGAVGFGEHNSQASDDETHDGGSSGTDAGRENQGCAGGFLKPNYYVESCKVGEESMRYDVGVVGGESSSQPLSVLHSTALQVNGSALPRTTSSLPANNTKYKQKMMEKYLRDTHVVVEHDEVVNKAIDGPLQTLSGRPLTAGASGSEFSKWLESAAKFTPDKHNYHIEWNNKSNKLSGRSQGRRLYPMPAGLNGCSADTVLQTPQPTQLELDAAEALANLAFNCRHRFTYDVSVTPSLPTPVNAITS